MRPARDAGHFQESKHPRAPAGTAAGGEFVSGAGGGASVATKVVGGQRVQANGEPLPAHIAALKIPPAWTDVMFSPDEDAELLATGKDAKGRKQALYSAAHWAKAAADKFGRIDELNKKFTSIFAQNEAARKSPDPKVRDAADCMLLIMTTGIRPGSERDTGAEKNAYGATTLQGKHVCVRDGKVRLRFVGKNGVDLDIPVKDPATAQMLLARKASLSGWSKPLFGISERELLNHVHSFDGGGFKTKDFRTLLGTRAAMEEVSKRAKPPTSLKEYKKAVKEVAKVVAQKLGNTPTIALQSYINPVVFADWKIAA